MITETLVKRLARGEVLSGEDATALLEELRGPSPWRVWVRVALEHLRVGRWGKAAQMLTELLAEHPE